MEIVLGILNWIWETMKAWPWCTSISGAIALLAFWGALEERRKESEAKRQETQRMERDAAKSLKRERARVREQERLKGEVRRCKSCGSIASGLQWYNHQGCPTCRSDLWVKRDLDEDSPDES